MTSSEDQNRHTLRDAELSMDLLRSTARIHKQIRVRAPVPSPNPQTSDLSTLLTGKPLELAKENPNPADAQTTKALLDAYHREDGWHCPRCKQVFTDPTTFAQHLIDEFNRAFAGIASQRIDAYRAATTRPPKPDKR